MEAPPSPTLPEGNWSEQLAQTLIWQRGRFQEFLAAQRQRLARLETELAAQVQQVHDEMSRDRTRTVHARESVEQQSGDLTRQQEGLARLQEELDARRIEWEESLREAGRQQDASIRQIQSQSEELDRRRAELESRRRDIETNEAKLEGARQKLAMAHQDHQAEVEHVASLRRRLEKRLVELDARSEELAAAAARTQGQRQRIAREFRAQHAAHLKELDRRRAELEILGKLDNSQLGRLQKQLHDVEQERDRLHEELSAARQRQGELAAAAASRQQETELVAQLQAARQRQVELSKEIEAARGAREESTTAVETARRRHAELSAELERVRGERSELGAAVEAGRRRLADLAGELESARSSQTDLASEVESLRRECEQQRRQAAAGATGKQVDSAQLEQIKAERDALARRLSEAEQRVVEAERRVVEAERRLSEAERRLVETPQAAVSEEADEDLRRRHEMALEDVRELKSQNEDLRRQLSTVKVGQAAAGSVLGGGLDWESQKRRILAALEAEADDDDESERTTERVKMEEVIRATDAALAAKDRELDEMRRLLDSQSASLGSVAVGAAALGEILDKDEIIREERENLRRLETEWKDKLRRAEIDISIERAKIARERAEIDEKLRHLGQPSDKQDAAGGKSDPPVKPVRGRWLSRLGLGETEKE
jgi:chromosome segregation ATPase